MSTPRSVASPSIIRPRRADATRGDRDKSKPAKVSVEQRATAKFTPTTTKCESSIGDSTAISRQFAPSSPCSQGSTSSRSGKRPLSAISFQRRSTRQTYRRSSFIVFVCLAGYPRNDRLPEDRLNLCKWSRTGAAGCIGQLVSAHPTRSAARPDGARAPEADLGALRDLHGRVLAGRYRWLPNRLRIVGLVGVPLVELYGYGNGFTAYQHLIEKWGVWLSSHFGASESCCSSQFSSS
jgi:hypothetical protein